MVTAVLAGALLLIGIAAAPFILLARTLPSAPDLIPVANARSVQLSEGAIRYEDEGTESHALLFLHGFNGQLGDWNAVWALLGDCARKVRVDIPGFGGSQFDVPSHDLDSQTRRLLEFLDRRAIREVTLVGESMGGSLAAYLAATHPERVRGLSLFAPSGYTGALRYPGLYGQLLKPGLLKTAATRVAGSRLYKRLFPSSIALQGLTVTRSYGPAWVSLLPRIEAPTLVVWSRGDFGVSHTTALNVRRGIHTSELLWLDERTGHLIGRERPRLVAELVCRLAQGASPADLAKTLPRELLRDEEGFAPRDPDV
jgi:pimeloyl-ACP methyl ester carboxylesterase